MQGLKWQIHIRETLGPQSPAKVEQELRGALIQRWLPYQDSWLRRAEQPERGSWKFTYNKGKHCRIINLLARLAYTPEKGLWRKLGKMWSDQNIPHLQSVPQLRGKTLGRVRQSHRHWGGVARDLRNSKVTKRLGLGYMNPFWDVQCPLHGLHFHYYLMWPAGLITFRYHVL